jgi:hypothetical protein
MRIFFEMAGKGCRGKRSILLSTEEMDGCWFYSLTQFHTIQATLTSFGR